MKPSKTNAMRILDSADIDYRISEYEVDESDLSGTHAAELLGIDPDIMFKTLVTRGYDNLLWIFVIPVKENLDLKKAAKVSGNKRIEMVHVKEILDLTGYVRGGCSPIGMKKQYPTYIDESATLYDEIYFSAGRRGQQIIMNPYELTDLIDAEFADLITM